jgi:ribosomal protein S12 methylthiotransferase accessory factor
MRRGGVIDVSAIAALVPDATAIAVGAAATSGTAPASKARDDECEPVLYRGTPHRAAKLYARSTHRVCPPAETLERILPVLHLAGITRLADVTGLDRIGIPTILAMRPNAPTLANSAGKGFSTTDAKVSAAMEGIELSCAEEEEHLPFDVVEATYDELDRSGLAPPVELLPLSRHSLFHRAARERWVLGWDLLAQRETAIPFETVTMCPGRGATRRPLRYSFQVGSNGLASGNVFLEAVCSALAELIERDALACANARSGHDPRRMRIVALDTIPYDRVRELLERLNARAISAVLFDQTGDTGVPTFEARLIDEAVPTTGVAGGYGAHLHPEVAMVRAITEAVQGRAVYIAGSRDDLTWFEHIRMRSGRADVLRQLAQREDGIDASAIESRATGSFEGDCHALLDAIRRVGLPSAAVVDLSRPELGVAAVRVAVPGLEGHHPWDQYAPGPRARRAATEAR